MFRQKGRSKLLVSTLLVVLLLLSSNLPIVGYGASFSELDFHYLEEELSFDFYHYFRESSRLVAENWCDGFFESIVFEVGKPYMRIDGTYVELEVTPQVVNGAVLLPICVINENTGKYYEVAQLNEKFYEEYGRGQEGYLMISACNIEHIWGLK